MSAPRVVSVASGSPAERAGIQIGDEVLSIDGRVPRDVIAFRLLVDEPDPELLIRRGHEETQVIVEKDGGEALGAEVSSAIFDRIRTCDNHCEFCFIYQLPKGMRRSLYLKDDDYRLSFLYGNFTTLTRFTEMDLERVLTEGLSPLFVSIHSTDRALRAKMLRNKRGATSLRWLRALLNGGVEIHGQVVVCPGVNDAEALETTMAGILDEFPDLETVACVPLGTSRFSHEEAMRPHTQAEAAAVLDIVEGWQDIFYETLGRRLVYAADEYYLLAGRDFPHSERYDGFPQHENGIGMARAFEAAFYGDDSAAHGVKPGFFAWVDGAPAEGYRAERFPESARAQQLADPSEVERDVVVVTGEYGARVLQPFISSLSMPLGRNVRLLPIKNDYFGGNIAVAGLMTGEDISRALAQEPDARFLLPDVCLSNGVFLDGLSVSDLPKKVEVIPTDGKSLREALLRDEAEDVRTSGASSVENQKAEPVRISLGASR